MTARSGGKLAAEKVYAKLTLTCEIEPDHLLAAVEEIRDAASSYGCNIEIVLTDVPSTITMQA